jgi:uncharacterized glyoxalase superfamily protein PhnB
MKLSKEKDLGKGAENLAGPKVSVKSPPPHVHAFWDFGDETYAVVWRDNSAIHFVRNDGSPTGVHLFQWVKDVDAYFREILGRGAEITMEPTNQPYGIRELGLRDINGVGIVFGQDIPHD